MGIWVRPTLHVDNYDNFIFYSVFT